MGKVDSWENFEGSEMGLENSNLSGQIGFFTKNTLTLYVHVHTHTHKYTNVLQYHS